MTYEEAMAYIKEAEKLGSKPGLNSIRNLLSRLDNPQDKIKTIHVAGTNGKGSTISFIAGILATAGYRVGIYISPVVFTYREKLQLISLDRQKDKDDRLQAEYISEEDVSQSIEIIKSACDDMVLEGLAHPTAFEIETAMAFIYMLKKQVDFLILETGMGGRLDATNVIECPICSVLTSVSLDHMQFLGDSLSKIAGEKAGIMKPGSCAITARQVSEVMEVFEYKADELGIPIIIADSSKAGNVVYKDTYTEFEYQGNTGKTEKYRIHLLGKHQVQNAVLAIETASKINSMGYNVAEEAIAKGIGLAGWSGRLEQVAKAPDFFIDGAHNEEAAQRLRESIEIYFTNRRLIFIIGVLADKDYKSMLKLLAPLADTIIALTPNNNRALSSAMLAYEASLYCGRVFDERNIEHAVERAYMEADADDVIIAFGSLSFLGELSSCLKVRKDEEND